MQHVLRAGRKLPAALSAVALTIGLAAALAVGASAHGSGSKRAATAANGLSISSHSFGSVAGQPVSLYTLSNGHRMTVKITNFGGVIQSIWVPGRGGRVANVALGFSKLADYLKNDAYPQPSGGSGTTYFGAIVGRYANRIANGKFSLNGQTYTLPQNNGTNTLHGGPNAMNTKIWAATPVLGAHSVALKLAYTDPDGYNGFPGAVTLHVTYTLTQGNALRIDYRATTTKPTVINLTNHTYFNLAGEGSGDVFGQQLKINANRYTPINSNLIPTGSLDPVAGTPLDFRSFKPIGRNIHSRFAQLVLAHGFDHNFVLNGGGGSLKLAAVAVDPVSGRKLTTFTTEPGVQFYSGNFLAGELVGTSGRTYRQSAGFTLETQHFPDSPNQPSFPSTQLNLGQTFSSTTVYKFGTVGRRF